MSIATNLNERPHTLKAIVGIVLGGIGVLVMSKTNTSGESLSVLGPALGGTSGLVAGLVDYVEPLRRAFEWGQWLLTGVAVLFVFLSAMNYFTLSLLIGLTLGFSSGVLISTVGVALLQIKRN